MSVVSPLPPTATACVPCDLGVEGARETSNHVHRHVNRSKPGVVRAGTIVARRVRHDKGSEGMGAKLNRLGIRSLCPFGSSPPPPLVASPKLDVDRHFREACHHPRAGCVGSAMASTEATSIASSTPDTRHRQQAQPVFGRTCLRRLDSPRTPTALEHRIRIRSARKAGWRRRTKVSHHRGDNGAVTSVDRFLGCGRGFVCLTDPPRRRGVVG